MVYYQQENEVSRLTNITRIKVIFLGRTTLKIWLIGSNIQRETEYLSTCLKQIEQELPFQAELRLMAWNRAFDTIVDAFKNDSAPDIFSIGTTWVHTQGYLRYLSPVPQSLRLKPLLVPWIDEAITVNGTVVAVPFLSEAYILMARQSTLERVGIQRNDLTDWDSFYASCMKLTNYFKARGIEHLPLAFPLRPEMGTLHRYVVWLYKGGWTFPKLRSGMDRIFHNEISIKALDLISSILKDPGSDLSALQTDTQSLMGRFQRSKDAFTFFVGNGDSYVRGIMNNHPDKDIALYPLPSLVPGAKTFGGGSVLAVASTSRHQELAWKVVEHLTRDEVLMGLCATNGSYPPYEGLFWNQYGDDPCIRVLKEQLKNSTSYTYHPIWRVVEQISGDYIAHYLWDSILNKNTKLNEAADQTLKDLDSRLIDVLNMMWEMEENETGRRY